jgi:hypothetical protein
LCGNSEQTRLLREGVLRHKLLPLQFLDSALHLVDSRLIHFERRFGRCRLGSCLGRGLGLLAACEPHDEDHQDGQADQ